MHKAFWNIEDGFKKDCSFPVRMNGKYYMADLYDQRKEGDPKEMLSFSFDGRHHFEDEFERIEWLDETAPMFTLEQLVEAMDDSYDAGWNQRDQSTISEYIRTKFNIDITKQL